MKKSEEITAKIIKEISERDIDISELGYSQRTLRAWKQGTRKVSLDTADDLLNKFGETVIIGKE